jgi:hypothetical protein
VSQVDFANNLKGLEELIASLGGADLGIQSKGSGRLLMEHLEAARRNHLGSMPGECSLSLREALGSIDCIPDEGQRTETKKKLQSLIAINN